MLSVLGQGLSFVAPRTAGGDEVDRIMRGETPPGKEGKALKRALIRMADLTGDAEQAASTLKTLQFPDAAARERYLERLEVCDGDLGAAQKAHDYFESQPELSGSFARLAAVTPGKVDQTLAHCEYLRQNSKPGPERDRVLKSWLRVLRQEQLSSPEEVAAFLAAPPPAPEPEPEETPPPAPAPAPTPEAGPSEIAARLLQAQPVDGLKASRLSKTLDRMADFLNGLEPAQKELEQLLPLLAARPQAPERLQRYLHFLELSDGRDGQALQAFQHVDGRGEKPAQACELILREGRPVDELKWLESKLPKDADLVAGARSYLDFTRDTPDQALYERTLALPPEAAGSVRKLEEVGMTCAEAVDDLTHLCQNGYKPEEFALLRGLREHAPRGAEVLKALDFLRGAPAGPEREQRTKAYLKLVEVGNDPAEALKDLSWLSTDHPATGLAQATETYLDLLGKVDREHHDELRDCYQKLHQNAPPAGSARSWFRRPVTYEGAYGTLLEFDPDPNQALSDLRLLQKHSAGDLRGGLKDLGDLFKRSNARDSAAVRTAYELIQAPPRWMSGDQLKKLVLQLADETADLGLGARMAGLLVHSPTEGEFRARRKAFSQYLELGNSTEQTVGLLETAERCLPPTDDLLKIHPILLEHNRNRSPELVAAALGQASQALARGRVDGQSSSTLFRAYLDVLCRSERTDEVEKLGSVLRQEGPSAYAMAEIMEPMLDGAGSVAQAVSEYHFVADLHKQWEDCPSTLGELARTHAGSMLVLKQIGRDPHSGARELTSWSFEHKNLPPAELITEVGRRLVMGAPLEKAKAEALEHFENGGRIKDKEDHVVIGGIRIGKREGQA